MSNRSAVDELHTNSLALTLHCAHRCGSNYELSLSSHEDEDERISLEVPDAISPGLWVNGSALTVLQQQIEVGDLVEFDTMGKSGTVLAVSNDHAWIDLGGGDYATRLLSTVQRMGS